VILAGVMVANFSDSGGSRLTLLAATLRAAVAEQQRLAAAPEAVAPGSEPETE
jgi:hypothetical protein